MKQTHFLFLIRRSPFGSACVSGCLDMLLTAAVFDQQVSIVFTGDSVPLLAGTLAGKMDSQAIGIKDPLKALSALPLYGVEQIYVEKQAMLAAGLAGGDKGSESALALMPLEQAAISQLIHTADRVFIC